MPDQPFTDDDLKAAAALMHYALTIEPNPADASAALSDNPRWLLVESGSKYDEQLRESVVELVSGAADVSRWAVDLGADGLQPEDHTLTVDGDDKPLVRLHCAFHPDLDDQTRISFMTGLARAMADAL